MSFAKSRPLLALVLLFISWKSILFILAILSPGPGYDTSTTLLISTGGFNTSESILTDTDPRLSPLYLKLARWDVIYFASIATRGHVFEQEWAWGLGHTTLLNTVSKGKQHNLRNGMG